MADFINTQYFSILNVSTYLNRFKVFTLGNVKIAFKSSFFLNGPFPAFFFIFVFSIQLTVNVQYKFLPMTGFELRTSGIGSDCSTN